jgi:hypothetical protein
VSPTERKYAKLAEWSAREAHAGQFRRDGVTPYITHPEKVVALLTAAGASDEEIAVAWLHDVLEDTKLLGVDLAAAGLPLSIIGPVLRLTKIPGRTDAEYLDFVGRHPVSRRVKIADMLANLTDAPTSKQVERYTRGILYLSSL